MAVVPSGVIFAWPGTNATIPIGWTRETSLDGYYIQGAPTLSDADLSTVRGNATHTHTSPAHTPTQNSHTHNFSTTSGSGTVSGGADTPAYSVPQNKHGHASTTSNAATAVNNSVAITVDAATNSLPYVEVIFIKSSGTPTGVPNTAYGLFKNDSLPTSWTRVHGNRYLKGAAAGGDGGATGGSDSHSHTSPPHTHTQVAHSHSSKTSNNSTDLSKTIEVGIGAPTVMDTHNHSVSLANTTATNQSVTTTINSSNHEPVYIKLNLISNGTGGADLPDQIIGIWGSTEASIPTDWARFSDADGQFIKHANANGESGSTGGATTHTHTASDCQPIQNSHTHTASAGSGTPTVTTNLGFALINNCSPTSHTHTWTITSTTATNNAVAVTIDTSASEAAYPEYKRVLFIQYTAPPVTDAPLRTLMGVGL